MRINNLFFVISLVCSIAALGQETMSIETLNFDDARSRKHLSRPASISDTIELPFLDDFSTYTGDPSSELWMDEGGVLINNGYAFSPPTVNVATFDGIDANGIPYVFPADDGNSNNEVLFGEADYLLSNPINLNLPDSTRENIALSFYWQKVGVAEELSPEPEEGDSLRLYFLDRDSIWHKVWPADTNDRNEIELNPAGGDFEYEYIQITDSALYFHDAFQFLFTSQGRLNGNLDSWNLDYIYLNHSRSSEVIQDFAFGQQPSSILKTYRAMPLRQFINNIENELTDSVHTTFTNLTTVTNFYQDSTATMYETAFSNPVSTLLDSTNVSSTNGGIINAGESIDISYELDRASISSNILNILNIGTADELVINTSLRMVTPIDIVAENDVMSFTTSFSNYYAYDDGTAEIAIGIREYGQIAVEYELNSSDTITAIDVYFPRSIIDLEGEGLSFKVWSSIEGVNGASSTETINTISTSLIYAEAPSALNAFTRINLGEPLVLNSGKFYVGYEQSTNEKIRIGLDLSNDQSDKIFMRRGLGAWWSALPSDQPGSIMIRPVFGENPISAVFETSSFDLNADLFPNPASHVLLFTGSVKSVDIFDLTGSKKISSSFSTDIIVPSLDISSLENGVYLVQMKNGKQSVTRKLVVAK